jgi:hypothetical protein
MCNARWAEGSATMITEVSRTIMSWAAAITTSAQKRFRSILLLLVPRAARASTSMTAIEAPPGCSLSDLPSSEA